MARDIIIVHVSTIASRTTFSLGGRVMFETRSSLNSSTNLFERLVIRG